MDFFRSGMVLDLSKIREELVKMEDTLIFNFIERSNFPLCSDIYCWNKESLKIPNFNGSFLDWSLLQLETFQSLLRRYEAPDENPFFPKQIPSPFLPEIKYPQVLATYSKEINHNNTLKQIYLKNILPLLVKYDGNCEHSFGSVMTRDIDCLQNLSRRIHFGKFVAEVKFQQNKDLYRDLIERQDITGIYEHITDHKTEQMILKRLKEKAEVYGIDPGKSDKDRKLYSDCLVKIYQDFIIPLTKNVEVDYLLRRLEDE